MYKRIFLAALLASLVSLFPAGARACAIPGPCTDQPWTTHIQSITPQAAIAGINQLVYVQGYCFGDSMGTVTINGVTVPETDIKFWTDHEIEFVLPSNATTGSLDVTSQNYGNDSSKKEAVCCGDGCSDNENWPVGTQMCGNDTIKEAFMRSRGVVLAALAPLTTLFWAVNVGAQASRRPEAPASLREIIVTGRRPVVAAIDAIEKRYGVLVDYSDPVYASTVDTQLYYSLHGKRLAVPILGLRTRTISVKYEQVKETPKGIPYLSCKVQSYACNPVFVWPKNGITALIRKVLKNLAAQGGPVFTVRKIATRSGPRWEVYPAKVRNSAGSLVPQPDFLAAKVHVPASTIGNSGVLRAVAQQLTRKWGHKFEPGCCLFIEGVAPRPGPIGHAISTSARRAILEQLGNRWVVRTFCGIGEDPCTINPANMPYREPPRPPAPPAVPAKMVPAHPLYAPDWVEQSHAPKGILDIQRALAEAGYLPTTPTTKWSANAVVALRRFQAANGLKQSGKFDIWTAQKLLPFLPKIPAHLEPARPAMNYALAHWLESTPDGRKEIEEGLTSAGFYHGPIKGSMNNPAAAAALKAFQEAHGLPPNGWLTYATAEKLAPYLPKPKE